MLTEHQRKRAITPSKEIFYHQQNYEHLHLIVEAIIKSNRYRQVLWQTELAFWKVQSNTFLKQTRGNKHIY